MYGEFERLSWIFGGCYYIYYLLNTTYERISWWRTKIRMAITWNTWLQWQVTYWRLGSYDGKQVLKLIWGLVFRGFLDVHVCSPLPQVNQIQALLSASISETKKCFSSLRFRWFHDNNANAQYLITVRIRNTNIHTHQADLLPFFKISDCSPVCVPFW